MESCDENSTKEQGLQAKSLVALHNLNIPVRVVSIFLAAIYSI